MSTLDTDNKTQVANLVRRCEAKIRLSAQAWTDGNNSGNSDAHKKGCARERRLAREAEAILEPLGIKVDWPGLYPSFTVRGFSEHSTRSAVLAAIGKPRNWLTEEECK